MEEKEKEVNIKKYIKFGNIKFNIGNQFWKNKPSLSARRAKEKKGCQFPTAYTILLALGILVFILTYSVQKVQYRKIEYNSNKIIFIVTIKNWTKYEMKQNKNF